MSDRLVLQRLEFEGFVGITESERTTPQPLAVDLELTFDMSEALATDDVKNTVDYAKVTERIVATAKAQQYSLIETLAENLAHVLLAEFSIKELDLWVRKLRPPINALIGSVGARITRAQTTSRHGHDSAPARWLIEHRDLLKMGRALDLACGGGRNALYLAEQGFRVDAWDRDFENLTALEARAQHLGIAGITTRVVDLEQAPYLPTETFDLIVVFYYLQRNLVPEITRALKPGGIVVYETFLIDNHNRFDHPHRKEFCLAHNELLTMFSNLRIVAYREGPVDPARGPFTASLIAERSS